MNVCVFGYISLVHMIMFVCVCVCVYVCVCEGVYAHVLHQDPNTNHISGSCKYLTLSTHSISLYSPSLPNTFKCRHTHTPSQPVEKIGQYNAAVSWNS